MLDPPIRQHLAEAVKEEKRAARIEAEVARRERSHERALRFNSEVADYRQELIAQAARDRATVDDARAVREESIAEMAPEEVALADARDAVLGRAVAQRSAARQAHFSPEPEWLPPAHVERGGPEIGM
jgi:hypothetical protein